MPAYRVNLTPHQGTLSSALDTQHTDQVVELSSTNLAAIKLLLTKIIAGVDVSAVVTAINAL